MAKTTGLVHASPPAQAVRTTLLIIYTIYGDDAAAATGAGVPAFTVA